MNQTFMQAVSRFPTHQNSYAGSKTSEYIIIIFGLSTKPQQLINVARYSQSASHSSKPTIPSDISFFKKPMTIQAAQNNSSSSLIRKNELPESSLPSLLHAVI